jgi:hypothetical protein
MGYEEVRHRFIRESKCGWPEDVDMTRHNRIVLKIKPFIQPKIGLSIKWGGWKWVRDNASLAR